MSDTIREYGCTLCQCWHQEDSPLFARHLYFQSKHGWRVRQMTRDEAAFGAALEHDQREDAGENQ